MKGGNGVCPLGGAPLEGFYGGDGALEELEL